MPLVSPIIGSPYPTIDAVMNLARVRVNDTMNSLAGDLLTDDAVYAETLLNAAWRWLQGKAYTAGVEDYIQETVLTGIPSQGSADAAFQSYVSWTGSYDGTAQYDSPALPQDLIQPLSVWRRESGTENAFCLMRQAEDGLPVWFDFEVYDWRQGGLYFYATTYAQDLRIRYVAFRPDLFITTPKALVPMMMCEDCLSARVAFEYANRLGASQAPAMAQMAEDAFATIAQRTSRRKQRGTMRRQPYSNRGFGNRWPYIH